MFARLYLALRSFIRKKILHIDDQPLLEIAISNGLRIGKDCDIQFESVIDWSPCWLIEIGDKVTLASHVHKLAHDASTRNGIGFVE